MSGTSSRILKRLLAVAAVILILKVTVEIILGYSNYFPPNFSAEFLYGRDSYFFGAYQWAFYPHIVSGPLALFLGLLLISDSFRGRWPVWHRMLGRCHVVNVLVVVVPSGLWMARYASTGTVAAVAFTFLSIGTGVCIALGWRAAVKRRFPVHRLWMWRSWLLLCSAVVLRLIGGFGVVTDVQSDWYDPIASWISWLLPLVVFEAGRVLTRWRRRTLATRAAGQ